MSKITVRSKIKKPVGWGKLVPLPTTSKNVSESANHGISSIDVSEKESIPITLYKTKGGRYLAKNKGAGLTKIEKAHGYKLTRGKTADFIKDILKDNPDAKISKVGIKNTRLQKWKVDGTIYYFDRKTYRGLSGVKKAFPDAGNARYWEPFRTVLADIGKTTYVGARGESQLVVKYDALTARQKQKFMLLLSDIDIDAFFNEFVDSDGTGHKKSNATDEVDLDKQRDGFELITKLLEEARL